MLTEAGLKPLSCRNISGLFAPVALFGIGGRLFWKVAFSIENILQRTAPWLFNYYVLLAARKEQPGGW
jgi:hypothetical protein